MERNASADEIRDSYRALVRLLHPDHQQDEALKAIAEKQLRKLNRIYAVLSDPERRRRYDFSREGQMHPPPLVFSPIARFKARELFTRFIWVGTALLGLILVIWLATDSPPAPAYPAPERANAAGKTATQPVGSPAPPGIPETGNSDEVSRLRAALQTARGERDEAQRELADLKSGQESVPQTPAAPATASPPPASAVTSPDDPVPPRAMPLPVSRPAAVLTPPPAAIPAPAVRSAKIPGAEAHRFAGFWFFTRSAQNYRSKSLYYPEFIEATLSEQNGVVRGRYRSRYRIVDRAISPDVNFEFSGTPGNGIIVCPWTGAGGAKGQLTLRMVGENDMKVDWTASDLGSTQGLASGTATLTRRLE